MSRTTKTKKPTYPLLLQLACKNHEIPYTWTYTGFRTDYTGCPICHRQVWLKLNRLKKMGMVQTKVYRDGKEYYIFTGMFWERKASQIRHKIGLDP